jgi:hypothetical protein
MNYGYDQSSPGWRPSRAAQLAERLRPIAASFEDAYSMRPYIEVDGLYPGVRIRRITHLSDEQRQELVGIADGIYDRVMGQDSPLPDLGPQQPPPAGGYDSVLGGRRRGL